MRCTVITVGVFVVLAALVPARRADAQHCLPFTTQTVVPIPRALRLKTTCGNGRIDTYAKSCERTRGGGCGRDIAERTTCLKLPERCDGRALDGQTCVSAGYAGGALRCASTCDDFSYDRCTMCKPGTSCKERLVRADECTDLRLFAHGSVVRAYWTNARELRMADVDPSGALVREQTLAKIVSTRLVPVQVGTSTMTIIGPPNKPVLLVIDGSGKRSQITLPGEAGMVFLPIIPVEGKPLGLIVVGTPFQSPHVLLVDERGASRPLVELYAQNAHRRVAVVPLAAGKHRVRWSTFDDELTAEAGDFLMVMNDGPWLSVIRNGIATNPFPKGPAAATSSTPVPEVTLDGKVIVAFGWAEDVAFGKQYPRVPPGSQALARVFGEHAYTASHIEVARTATHEVQASCVRPPGNPEHQDFVTHPRHTLAVSVRELTP
ncbi:MAG: hypothetical protein H0T89_27220 [Deltaproteobacteria bacterium]|nr:hypothetical protein [Deltaproteobacteria bacterium]MDQ3298337.1 hypothetical protein [Myxococcota bacterium]